MSYSLFFHILLSSILLLSAAAKWLDPLSFRVTLEDLDFTRRQASIAASLYPYLEAAIAIMLLIPASASEGRWALVGLLILFSCMTWKSRGRHIKCNCFGKLTQEQFGALTWFRILTMFVITVYLLIADSPGWAAVEWEDIYTYGFASLSLMAIYAISVSLYNEMKTHSRQGKGEVS